MLGKFNLKEGMYDENLWKELTKVGISGETKDEIKGFREPGENYYHKTDKALHQVLMSNTKYAIIRKNNVTIDPLGGVSDNFSYYLCGINDEQMYFIRPLFTLPRFPETPNLQQVVDWVNRKDQGFLKRIQGDVLIKFIHKAEIPQMINENEIKEGVRKTIEENRRPKALFSRSVEPLQPLDRQPRSAFEGFFRADRRQSVGTFGLTKEIFLSTPSNSEINIGDKIFRKIKDTPIKLGNHKLWIEGEVYAGVNDPFVALIGQKFILQHPEHQVVEQEIPEHSIAVLAAQRGRDFQLKDYLAKSFD